MPIFIPASHSGGQARAGAGRPDGRGSECSRRSAQHGFTFPRRSAQHGFTLLEMLVALVVFSLAALALVRLQAVSVRTAADLRQRTLAEIVARNLAFERLTDAKAPSAGQTEGTLVNGGQTFHWQQQAVASNDGRLMTVTIRVEGGPGQSPALLSFGRTVTP